MKLIALPGGLDALDLGVILAGLVDALEPTKRRLGLLTLPSAKPEVHPKWLRGVGGINMGDTGFAWCHAAYLLSKTMVMISLRLSF